MIIDGLETGIVIRAWDNDEKRMGQVVAIGWWNDKRQITSCHLKYDDGTIRKKYPHKECGDDIDFERWTGLTDRNGKRIFEGDRCRVTRTAILAYGVITFANGCFWFKDDGPGGLLRLCDVKTNGFEIEVIGTIHDQKAPA